jgi:hypothetical protein
MELGWAGINSLLVDGLQKFKSSEFLFGILP